MLRFSLEKDAIVEAEEDAHAAAHDEESGALLQEYCLNTGENGDRVLSLYQTMMPKFGKKAKISVEKVLHLSTVPP
jgi:hypothetical protein